MAPPIPNFDVDLLVERSPRMKRKKFIRKITRKILKVTPYIILLVVIFLSLRALG